MKRKKNAPHLVKSVKELILGTRYKPSSMHEIAYKLRIPENLKKKLHKILESLCEEGLCSYQNGKYLSNKKQNPFVIGILHLHPKGFGFVEALDKKAATKDVFIPKSKTKNGVNGDTVKAEIIQNTSPKGPEGLIIEIVKRGKNYLSGTIVERNKNTYLVFVYSLGGEKTVEVSSEKNLEIGDRICMKVTDWGNASGNIRATYTKKIGSTDKASTDLSLILEEFNIIDTFPAEVLDELKNFGKKVSNKDCENREDLTHLEAITIDPQTAKDFDDALSLEKDEEGNFHLGVHIADVAHYIKAGTALDAEAYERSNSTYFPDKCIPMLPEALSNGLCSLRPNTKRLCMSVLVSIDKKGNTLNYKIVRSVIKSAKRFSYETAYSILQKKKKSPFSPLIQRMSELCTLFQKQRFQRGSIDFSLPSVSIRIDDSGNPYKLETVEYDLSHQIVEEFMLKANELVAKHLSTTNNPLIYRVHKNPDEESMRDFISYVKTFGFHVKKPVTQEKLQTLFTQVKESPFYKEISLAFIKSMNIAIYSPDNIGHYGLALEYYCHFTSPIRRYTDLIIQRLLCQETPCTHNLSIAAKHSSEKERKSMKAENMMILLKKFRFLEKKYTENPQQIFTAYITKIKPHVLFFDLREFFLESSMESDEVGEEFFIYRPRTNVWEGITTRKKYRLGDTISLTLHAIDLLTLKAKWKLKLK